MPSKISRAAYADMFGPTAGDRVRLADTSLFIEIEKDFTIYGEEVKFGGGKVIRDGMGQSQVTRASGAVILRSLLAALPSLLLPFVIRTAVVEGVATATEVSTIGIVYGVLAGLLIYRQFDWRRLYPMLLETASLSGSILLIIGAATAMAWGLTQSGFSSTFSQPLMYEV